MNIPATAPRPPPASGSSRRSAHLPPAFWNCSRPSFLSSYLGASFAWHWLQLLIFFSFMKVYIAVLASGWPPFAHACLTSSVLKSVWTHGAGASSADALIVANVSTPVMERMLAINPSLDIDVDPCVLQVLALTAPGSDDSVGGPVPGIVS